MAKASAKYTRFLVLLLMLPIAWFWWSKRESVEEGEPSADDSPAREATSSKDEAKVPAVSTVPPPRLAFPEKPALPSPPTNREDAKPRLRASNSTSTAPAELSDAAIAAFGPETVKMLNSHKYWTPKGLVDGLYDVWVSKKSEGLDVEDVRQQIAWALRGAFMEEY